MARGRRWWRLCFAMQLTRSWKRRGHAVVRDAEDGNVYVRSWKAGARVLVVLRKQSGHLRLRINE